MSSPGPLPLQPTPPDLTPWDVAACQQLAAARPVTAPQATLAWTALVDIDAREDLGPSSHGQRFLVAIKGGRFWGGPQFPALCGTIRPGGADRQLLRPDGVRELRALYEMQTDDGAVLTIDNRVLIDDSVQPVRYALSRVLVAAPAGPHAWLNRRVFVGTLQPLRPEREAVLVRSFLMTA